jgi:hypothetical protein
VVCSVSYAAFSDGLVDCCRGGDSWIVCVDPFFPSDFRCASLLTVASVSIFVIFPSFVLLDWISTGLYIWYCTFYGKKVIHFAAALFCILLVICR